MTRRAFIALLGGSVAGGGARAAGGDAGDRVPQWFRVPAQTVNAVGEL
jgi:hypothetical protein